MSRTDPDKTLESGTTTLYDGPAAWTATDMRGRDDWIVPLDTTDITELETAVSASRDVPIVGLTRNDFILPTLGAKLDRIAREVVDGRGFVLIRGLPVSEFDRQTVARMYYGIGTRIGDPVPQNAAGHLLGHVRDIGQDPHNPEHRVYATNYRHQFHTDTFGIKSILQFNQLVAQGNELGFRGGSIRVQVLAVGCDLVQADLFSGLHPMGVWHGDSKGWVDNVLRTY